MVGLRRPSAAVHRVHSPWQNEKTSPAESLVARRFAARPNACPPLPRPPAREGPAPRGGEGPRRGGRAKYRANEADQQAWESALRPKPCLLATHTTLREIVASKLMQDWSPEQVSGWLKWQFPKDEGLRVSHETIYRSLFLQARGALKKELIQHLRSQRRIRRSRHSSVHGHSQGKIVDAISIRERPAEVEDRAIPGHWEGDLLRGARNSHVATLVERHSRFCMLVKVPGKDTTTVVAALSRHVRTLPATLRRSLTWDRGLEMAQHKSFTSAIPKAHGSAVRTKTRTGCCGNTCRRRRICAATHSRTWTRSLCASINGHEKHWDLKLRRIDCKPVLHRPLETTPVRSIYPKSTSFSWIKLRLFPAGDLLRLTHENVLAELIDEHDVLVFPVYFYIEDPVPIRRD